eukprot:Protomagalhaensia_sp_Gyna_25__4442@NODE_406_length_3550_cov_9_261464_g312_i0_p3_GENE_NODE_406_length_3550_cov_9_261464_g312_i0NODE_406_length_3550_cov_9_261464_g312_i0_p3_ORF_typecomplete_len178_score22_28_NODE_406_length_3550_cov_9_261464_g312_i031564
MGHENGLLSRWQITFPYRGGKGVQMLDYMKIPYEGEVSSVEAVKGKQLVVGISGKDSNLRLVDLPLSLEIPKGCRTSSSVSESIIIPDSAALVCAPKISANGLLATAYRNHIDVWHLQSKEVMYHTPLDRRLTISTTMDPNNATESQSIESLLWLGVGESPCLLSCDTGGCVKVWSM